MISDEEFRALHGAPPDKQMDHPDQSSFWRRRAALMLGLRDRNAPWVDIVGEMEHREYQRDVKFAGELALRHLRVEVDRLKAEIAKRDKTIVRADKLANSVLAQMNAEEGK